MSRPSSLPKLAECVRFEGKAGAGPAAERGNTLDKLYREVLGGVAELDPNNEEHKGISWAVDVTRILANKQADDFGPEIFTTESILWKEDDLRVQAMGMQGTADCALPHARASIDLKTGQERNYMEQQALYALGFMSRYNVDKWTVVLLYSDLRKMVELKFTRYWAESMIRNLMARVNDPLSVATPCDYCNWCAKKYTCPERLETVAFWAGKDPATIDWQAEMNDPVKLAQFINLCSLITSKDGLEDYARGLARDKLNTGEDVPGFVLRNRKGREYVEPETVAIHAEQLGIANILAAYGSLSAEKFKGLWETALNGVPFPTDEIKSGPGSQFVASQPKPKTKPLKS
jgi:CRISPR/Cas system-associated exonuclease Cas4 (RecB family)